VLVAFFDGRPEDGGHQIGFDVDLGLMSGGRSLDVGIDWNTLGLSGLHRVVAVIDPQGRIDESNRLDNRSETSIDLGSIPSAPDAALLRELISASPTTLSAYPATVHVSGKVRNLGSAALVGMPLALYAVTDTARRELSRTTIDAAGLADGTFDLTGVLHQEDGLHLLLVADPENQIAEFRETNNELRIDLGTFPGVDLAVQPADLSVLTSPAVVRQPVQLRAVVHNNGTSDSPTFMLAASVSQAGQTDALTPISVQLAAGASAERQWTWTPPATGTATLRIEADPQHSILSDDRGNNTASVDFTVVEPGAANLTIDGASIVLTPVPLDVGHAAHLHAVITNSGAAITSDVPVTIAVGSGAGARTEIGRTLLSGGVPAGGTRDVEIDLPSLVDAGDRYFFVTADPDNLISESNDTDNTGFLRAHVRSRPDAAISIASIRLTPSTPQVGANVHAEVTVLNLGEQPWFQQTR
jgi:subtilase family serine protease